MPEGGPAFSSVRKARSLLREKQEEILQFYINLAKQAAANGDFETAEKIGWKLLDHGADDDGTTTIAPSVDIKAKQITESAAKGPTINIGVAIGGLGQKSLPESPIEVVDVTPERDSDK